MKQRAPAAIFFTADDFHLAHKELKGRQAAGNFFLRGLLRHSAFNEISLATFLSNPELEWKKSMGLDAMSRSVRWIHAGSLQDLSQIGCIYFSAPNFEHLAYMRLGASTRAYSICGITHTTASCLNCFSALPAMPVFSWDALICTSRSVRDTIRTVLEDSADYYAWRFGSGRTPLPQLPLIPIGILSDEYYTTPDEQAMARKTLSLQADEIAVLFMGRLSFHGKANLAAMFMALEEVAKTTNRAISVILCGWFANKHQEEAFRSAAKILSPSLRLIMLDGRETAQRKQAWAGADIFCSLSDNIQETFGLTPLEGMAAGLPVVVSDWDGYRDTVRHGIDGFRVRTITLPSPLGQDLASQYVSAAITYDYYIGYASQATAVDLTDCVKAFTLLIDSPELRKKMGQAGQRRAKEEFDWEFVIQQYEELWGELAERRRADAEPAARYAPNHMPAFPDPFHAFGTYSSEQLSGERWIRLRVERPIEMLKVRSALGVFSIGKDCSLQEPILGQILGALELNGPTTVEALAEKVPPEIRARLAWSIMWFAKMGLIEISSEK